MNNTTKQIKKLVIHPAYDMFGRWWAIFNDDEEIKSFDKYNWSLDEVITKLKEQYGKKIEIEIDGKKILD